LMKLKLNGQWQMGEDNWQKKATHNISG
jgi:hypothetical protein